MREHRNLLEVAFAYGDSFKFYLSSKLPRDMYGDESSLKAFLCKEKDCAVRHYDGEFKVISLASFIQSLTLPLAIILDQDQKIPYADENLVSIPINQVFMFVSNIDDTEKYRSELEDVAKNMKSAVGFIVVLVEHHPTFIRQFGLAEDSHYPALGFVPGHKSKLDEEEFSYADVFTSSEASLVTDKLADFVSNLITSPQRVADQDENRSFTVNFPMEYLRLLRDLDADYMLVAICKSSVEVCGDFSHNFQRLSRTFDRHFRRRNTGKRNIKFSFIYTERDMDPKFEIKSYPTVRLHKKGDPVTNFLPLEGPYYYDQLVEFVQAEINENDVIMLPKSFLDHADLERVSEDGNTVVGDVHDAETSERTNEEDEEQEERPPEELEDDEVAVAGYEIYYTKAVNDSHVPKLNDTSFNRTVTKFDISVVFFFLPWDARSQAFSPSYAGAAKKLVETDGSDVKIGVHQVNCFDWEDVCGKENIISYPTIRIYRRNQLPIDYNGILDETSLIKTVKLLQTISPVKLPSDGEVNGFRDGEYPMPSILYTDVSIIGLFSDENSEHVAFISAAHKMEGQFLCGYVVGKIAFDMASRFGVNVPSIVLIKRNDPLETQVVFEGEYTAEAIVSFVKHSSLPKYGELTPLNFPSYFSKGKPFLIAFIGKGNAEINSLISDVAKSKDSGKSITAGLTLR
ncbi:uncharacterized protein LOC124446347 [Xenia sp. Carnegie-2017]|uniref:uncharacterized protein LOC124446347 n=1 Tax=Xenia sp. Carnegie-2017 TaxID=2897299 RepID=UPI001F03A927|nr:uncharacterized protein LOC124446347 [Xenia sp. Carnegie-2017]XP_046853148.1 uncharacterized protein LOC124446347 [Xenia sp. Carnegie-2017]